MAYDLSRKFVIATSSRALFDLSRENRIFETQGAEAFEKYQAEHQDALLRPGPAFPLIRAMLRLNEFLPDEYCIEVVLMSRNSVSAGVRVRRSIAHHNLNISRSVFTTGGTVSRYLRAFHVNVFFSAHPEDVKSAADAGVPSAMLWGLPRRSSSAEVETIRIAFDGDAVLFAEDSERIYQERGLDAFHDHEAQHANVPLGDGPWAKVLRSLGHLQRRLPSSRAFFKTAIVTARNAPADVRVARTLEKWGARVDEVLFLGGMRKDEVLAAFDPHLFIDDQAIHCSSASVVVPTAQVPSNLFTLSGAICPPCPRCGGETVQRVARRGPREGRPFFGCRQYPACTGSVSVA